MLSVRWRHDRLQTLFRKRNITICIRSKFILENTECTVYGIKSNSEETNSMPIWTSHWPVSTTSNILIQVYKSLSTNLKESTTRNYWVFIYMNTKWDRHVNEVFNAYQEPILIGSCACYGTLWTLPKLKNFTDSILRKRLVESLVLSKLDYCDSV